MEQIKLTYQEQIAHLAAQGVTFNKCTHKQAIQHLRAHCYQELAPYKKLYPTYANGPNAGHYIHLDFEDLIELSTLDQQLQRTLLNMVLNIERALRSLLLENLYQHANEDGWQIVEDYLNSLASPERTKIYAELKRQGSSVHIPMWQFIHSVSLGPLVAFTLFCSNRWDNKELRGLHFTLKNVRLLRNQLAHSKTLLDTVGQTNSCAKKALHSKISQELRRCGVSERVRKGTLTNEQLRQITCTLYVHSVYVKDTRLQAQASLELRNWCEESHAFVAKNKHCNTIAAAFGYINQACQIWSCRL